jgi:hypothetical protein
MMDAYERRPLPGWNKTVVNCRASHKSNITGMVTNGSRALTSCAASGGLAGNMVGMSPCHSVRMEHRYLCQRLPQRWP